MIGLIRFVFLSLLIAQTTNATLDLSTPQSAAKALHDAVAQSDEIAMRKIFYARDDSQRALDDCYIKLNVATKHLSDAIALRFGASGDALALAAASMPDVQAIAVARFVDQPDGSVAMTSPGQTHPLIFRRDQNKNWQVDLVQFAGAPGDELKQQVAMLGELAASIGELAGEIHENRYQAMSDVKAAVQDRVHGAIAKSLRHDRPATNPNTNPATRPSSS